MKTQRKFLIQLWSLNSIVNALTIVAFVGLASCATKKRGHDAHGGNAAQAAAVAINQSGSHHSEMHHGDVKSDETKKDHSDAGHAHTNHAAESHDAHVPTAAAPAPHDGAAVGTKELGWLKNGNARFTRNALRNDFKKLVAKQVLLKKLSGGQKPHTIVLSCSDSRVPPELVFDQVMGEIFVIRVAGQALDSSVIASIEYAAEHLGSQLLLVMGHEACGAVKAAINTPVGSSAGSASLDKLVADIRPRIEQSIRKPADASVLNESWANTKGIAKELLAESSILSHLVAEGKLRVSTAMYRLGSGVVEFE